MSKIASHRPTSSRSGDRKAAAKSKAGPSRRRRASAKPRFTLHGSWFSGPTYKVGLMLSLSGVPFSYVHVDLREGEHKKPEHLAKNRYGQVPCLTIGGEHLCQSASILGYLADALGQFRGRSEKERLRIREWLFWDFDRLAPAIYRARGIKRGFRQASDDILAMYQSDGKAALAVLDLALANSKFLVGDRATIADIDVYGVVHFAPEGGYDLSDYPNVRLWMRRIEALKGFGAPAQILPKESRA